MAAALVCVVGILLLWGVWRPPQVAAAFTRVGGVTRVETALEASRFWLAPQRVVTTEAGASQPVMMEAARCAMAYDAPLLFNSPDRARRRLVIATINSWKIKVPQGIRARFWIKVPAQGGAPPSCRRGATKGKNVGDGRLSVLHVPGQPYRLPYIVVGIPARPTLAPFAVFAALKGPRDPPDVAVGLALAAHLAREYPKGGVSLVVVPRYLEADPGLENQLRNQHALVTGGVVLGQPPTVPDDTSALLRQLLIATDRQGVLGQIQANLGTVAPLVGALFALLGFTTAARVIPEIALDVATGILKTGRAAGIIISAILAVISHGLILMKRALTPILALIKTVGIRIRRWFNMDNGPTKNSAGEPTQVAGAALLASLHDDEINITVWLRSGWRITGGREKGPNTSGVVLRLNDSSLAKPGQDIYPLERKVKSVLVPVEDIELIVVDGTKT